MPLYEYECKKCGIFEVLQRIKDEPLKACPVCNETVEKIMSSYGAVIFKCDGFYETDYKKKNNSGE